MAKVAKTQVLPPAVGVYVSLFTPRDPPAGSKGKPRYSLVLLYPKSKPEVLDGFRKAALEVAEAKWPGKGASVVKRMKWPIIADGDERYPDDPTFAGMLFIRASTQADPQRRPPGVVNAQAKVVMDDGEAYSGCTFRTSVRLFPFDTAGSAGVGVGLNNVQVVRQGVRLDGRKNAEDEFKEFAEPEDAAGGGGESLL
jgi:hypothetical protein